MNSNELRVTVTNKRASVERSAVSLFLKESWALLLRRASFSTMTFAADARADEGDPLKGLNPGTHWLWLGQS